MSTKKRQTAACVRKQMKSKARKNDATKWLSKSTIIPEEILSAYSKRYGVDDDVAMEELASIGYYEEVQIARFKKDGIEWEYKYDGYSGEMKVVPQNTPEWELHEF